MRLNDKINVLHCLKVAQKFAKKLISKMNFFDKNARYLSRYSDNEMQQTLSRIGSKSAYTRAYNDNVVLISLMLAT